MKLASATCRIELVCPSPSPPILSTFSSLVSRPGGRTLPSPQRRNDLTAPRSTATEPRIHRHAAGWRSRRSASPGHVDGFLAQDATVDDATLLRSLHELARRRRVAPLDPLHELLERRPVAGQDRPQPVLEAAGLVSLVIVRVDVRSVLDL